MKTLLQPLDQDELAQLDEFLLSRVAEEEESDDEDPGVISISELDGLLTALVSGPVLPTPDQWMPIVWGDFEPEWESEQEFQHYINLMMRHMNTVAATLVEAPQEFEPLFLQDDEDGEAILIVDDWCEGYVKGVTLELDQWRKGGSTIERLLLPIRAFSSVTDWLAHSLEDQGETEQMGESIAPNVRDIHKFWLQQKKPPQQNSPWHQKK